MNKLRIRRKKMYTDPEGHQIPAKHLREQSILRDYVAETLVNKALELQEQLQEFKQLTIDYMEQYRERNAKLNHVDPKAGKGNISASSFDGTKKVEIDSHPFLDFGTGLQDAQGLMLEVLTESAAGLPDGIKQAVMDAFTTNKGQINTTKVLALTTYKVEDNRWKNACKIIWEEKFEQFRRRYVRFHTRGKKGPWKTVYLDIAKQEINDEKENGNKDN